MQVPADGCCRRVEQLGDLRYREAVDLEELHNQTAARGKTGKHSAEALEHLVPLSQVGWRGMGVGELFGKALGRPNGSGGIEIQPPVQNDASEPGPERSLDVEAVDVLEGGEECVLDEVLGVLAVLEDTRGESDSARQVALDEQAKCLAFPPSNPGQEGALLIPLYASVELKICGRMIDSRGVHGSLKPRLLGSAYQKVRASPLRRLPKDGSGYGSGGPGTQVGPA